MLVIKLFILLCSWPGQILGPNLGLLAVIIIFVIFWCFTLFFDILFPQVTYLAVEKVARYCTQRTTSS